MDFRAVKIILAAFLLIAFVIPLLKLSVVMPGKGKDDSVNFVKTANTGAHVFTPASIALMGSTIPSDSTFTSDPGNQGY
jgi:hypothetical protein